LSRIVTRTGEDQKALTRVMVRVRVVKVVARVVARVARVRVSVIVKGAVHQNMTRLRLVAITWRAIAGP